VEGDAELKRQINSNWAQRGFIRAMVRGVTYTKHDLSPEVDLASSG
jgi:hypothetical protein